jgi:UDP-N-acetyl-2-amino-2-deoxyglucuronate dehydrogenase
MSKTFALIGAAGYVAPRHMASIRDTGGELVAALDPHDSVGVLDSYAPACLYFREPERFDRWLSRNPVDYVVVCSPNYLHDAHCLMAMRNGADVICEKPLALHEHNLDNLAEWEQRTGRRVNVILQCRLHPSAQAAQRWVDGADRVCWAEVRYFTPRGRWYDWSWKGDPAKSGGILFNLGIHLFDLACWLFGDCDEAWLSGISDRHADGHIEFDQADVAWRLSSEGTERKRQFEIWDPNTPRNIVRIDLSDGFEGLHAESYRRIMAGWGFTIESIRPATRLVEGLRDAN